MQKSERKKYIRLIYSQTFLHLGVTLVISLLLGSLFGGGVYLMNALCSLGFVMICWGWFTYLKMTGMNPFFGKSISFAWDDPDSGYGNAVLSKFPIVETEVVPIPDPEIKDEEAYYETRSVSRVKINVNGTAVTVLQTHFGLAVSEQQNAQQTILKLLDTISGPVILMGDFNIRPNNFLLDPIRERLMDTAFLREGYFKTFPSYFCDYPDCKIDYVFVSKHFKAVSLDVVQTLASDHLPYAVEVEL